MNLNRLKLSQLRALVAVAAHGNFSEAALQLNLSQSTVSHAIATLEAELGVVLLQRGRYGAKLTPVGDRILAHARQLLDTLEAIGHAAEQAKGLEGGTIRVASFRSVATNILPEVIARLHGRYPNLSVHIVEVDETHQMQRSLVQGEVDVCVAETLYGEEFETVHFFDDDYIALLPPGAGLRNAQLTHEDLRKFPLIASSHGSCGLRVSRELEALQAPLKLAYRIRHDSSMVAMVKQGLGIAILPRLAAAPIPEDVSVCTLPFPVSRPIGATMLKDALHTPAVYAFLDALRQTPGFGTPKAV